MTISLGSYVWGRQAQVMAPAVSNWVFFTASSLLYYHVLTNNFTQFRPQQHRLEKEKLGEKNSRYEYIIFDIYASSVPTDVPGKVFPPAN